MRVLENRVNSTGAAFDPGTLKGTDELVPESGSEPAELLARIFAHLGHRLPLLKKVEKRLEGKDLKAGIGADIAALAIQIYGRNKHLIPLLVAAAKQYSAQAAAEREAAKQDRSSAKTGDYSAGSHTSSVPLP